MNIAACVVLYNPEYDVIDFIKSYIDEVEKVYVIDNSEDKNVQLIETLKEWSNVQYTYMNGNKGIGSALNVGMEKARNDAIDYLLTMDQDSCFGEGVCRNYLDYAENMFLHNKAMAICGIRTAINSQIQYEYGEVDEVITSGMIISLRRISNSIQFEEKLFIDFVDYDFCYKVKKLGYKCYLIEKYCLEHQIGSLRPINVFGYRFNDHNHHGKLRYYYMYRNAIYIIKKYPYTWKKEAIFWLKSTIKLFLVEANKFGKFKYAVQGMYDGMRGNFGKYI